jgi:hypothetical protein
VLKPIVWLKEVIPAIGGTVPLVQSTLDGRNFVKLSISFDIRSRGESSGDITIRAYGNASPIALHTKNPSWKGA